MSYRPGDFVKKPMSACTGRETLTEILGHLHLDREAAQILKTSICIPCMMQFITSQFGSSGESVGSWLAQGWG